MDQLLTDTRKTFDVPGMSVGIIKDGKIIYAKGSGVASLTTQKPMTPNTLVGIASNSKGFTATALAMLADEGKLKLSDPVIKYLPEFRMYDQCLTQQVTIKDLLTHRAGLGLGQGDLMFFPEGGRNTPADIVRKVQYLKPEHGFRETMDYNNIMFIVAGEVIHRVSGLSWADFIEQRIMKPVGMTSSFGSYSRAAQVSDKISAHAPVDGKAIAVPHDWHEAANAAGGIMSNIPDMLKWANFLINNFTTEDGKKLVSDALVQQLWSIQQPIPVAKNNPYHTQFYGYGLGWFLSDVYGYKQVQHTGGLIGTVTQFTVIPELKLGIVVLTNQQSGAAFNAVTNTVKDAYLPVKEKRNWLATLGERNTKMLADVENEKAEVKSKIAAFSKVNKNAAQLAAAVVGTYHDAWFGDVVVTKQGNVLRITSMDSPRLVGSMEAYSPNTYVVRWHDRSYDADAFFTVQTDENGKVLRATMKPISSITDFSFDFEDLDLRKVK